MKKLFSILITFILFSYLFSNAVSAESDSVFGSKLNVVKEVKEQHMSKFREAMEGYRGARSSYMEASEDKAEGFRQLMLEKAKNVLTKRLDFAKKHLDRVLSRVEGSSLSDEEKRMVEDLVVGFSETVENYKVQVGKAESIEELKDIAKEINQEIKRVLADLKKTVALIRVAKSENIAGRFEDKAEVVRENIDAAGSVGHDVSNVQETYDEAMKSLEAAQETYDEALDLIEDGMVTEGHKLLISANGYLRDAYKGFKEAVRMLKDLYKNTSWEVS